MSLEEKEKKDDKGLEYYTSADGRVHSSPQKAVDGSLTFEESSNTGAGCSQDSGNIPDKK